MVQNRELRHRKWSIKYDDIKYQIQVSLGEIHTLDVRKTLVQTMKVAWHYYGNLYLGITWISTVLIHSFDKKDVISGICIVRSYIIKL